MSDESSTPVGEESTDDSKQGDAPNPSAKISWHKVNWPVAGIITLIACIATILWFAIDNVDDDVDRLSKRVNQIDDNLDKRMGKIDHKFDEKMGKITEKMDAITDDIAFIKGRIKSISSSAKNNTSQQQLSAKDNVDQPAKEIPFNLSIQRK